MKLLYPPVLNAFLSIAASSVIPTHRVLQDQKNLQPRFIDTPAEWEKAWCKGAMLVQATIKNEDQAAAYITPVRSSWDGDLKEDFRTWGYREIPDHQSQMCDFGPEQHNLERAFAELGIGTASSIDGGPNNCFYVEHKYGATVQRLPNGLWPDPGQQYYMVGTKRYRVSCSKIPIPVGVLTIFRKHKHTVALASTPLPELSTSSIACHPSQRLRKNGDCPK
jgi:hypothetical protein